MPVPSITLVVETAEGTFLRPIRPATVLPVGVPIGPAAENATRTAAAYWGLPDFVFRPQQQLRGSGVREIGDAIVVVGDMGASVQVKARHEPTGDDARERSWLDKSIRKAGTQAAGTVRALNSQDEVELVNERGRAVKIRPSEQSWIRLAIIDHPRIESYVPNAQAVVLIRRDWEFLFEQLKSTYAVMEYLRRISSDDPIPLGQEPIRYYRLAAADAATPPSPADSRLLHLGLKGMSLPQLPQAPAGHGHDMHHTVVRAVMEDISTIPLPSGTSPSVLLEALAAIDATPVGYRAELGGMWLSWLRDVAQAPPGQLEWRFRSHIWPDRPYLLFGAAPRYSQTVQEAFGAYLRLRHEQHLDLLPERAGMLTVGVLLTPRVDGRRAWDTTLIAGKDQQRMPDDERTMLEGLWGRLGESRTLPQTS